MKKIVLILLACMLSSGNIFSQEFHDYFLDRTLRLDYIFAGNSEKQAIYVDGLSQLETWAGRRTHLSDLPLEGNGQLIVKDISQQTCIYKTSFSSLFQEWLLTDEASAIPRAFENTFLVPFPKHPVEIEVLLFNNKREVTASVKHIVSPSDILIRKKMPETPSHRYLLQSGNYKDVIDIAILAEGYNDEEMETFYKDADIAMESLFSHEPFKSMKNRFNVVAVASPSIDNGVSIPHQQLWKETTFDSHFDTFYSKRYLTTSRVKQVHDALAGIPYEHIIILANTPQYGGGGIYNAFTLTTAHHPLFRPVVVHEFGHSFGGLADEYFYEEDVMNGTYPLTVEPWEQNVTTLVHFEEKWENMLKTPIEIPTPVNEQTKKEIGVFEGGGYASKGMYRGAYDCRMRTNNYPGFCPVCRRAIERMIRFYTE